MVPIQAQSATPPEFITVEGRYLVRNGARFEVRGMNYYPKDYAWDRFWTNYTDTTASAQIDIELDKAKALGINTVRFFIPYNLFSGTVQTAPYPAYLRDFVDRLQARDMVAIVTLFDFYTDKPMTPPYSVADYPTNTHHISTVVHTLGITNPAILAWDLKNELDRDYAHFDPQQVKDWAREMISQTKGLDANHLITLGFYGFVTNTGTYSPAIAAEFADEVDFVSLHYFLSERDFERDLQVLQAGIGEKPIVLEEFGLHTLANPMPSCQGEPEAEDCDDPHTETEQAAYYNALLSLSEAYNIAGYLFWTLNDFSYILSGTQKSHHCQGILRNSQVVTCEVTITQDYAEKPAADTVRRHYEDRIAYLDLFDSWVAPDTDLPPPGWSDNWVVGGGLLRGYSPTQILWSYDLGKVAFTKFVTNNTSTIGLALSPVLTNVNINRYSFLTGQVFSYSLRDTPNGSSSTLHIGVKEEGQIMRLLTITPGASLPYTFKLDLRQLPIRWCGANIQISLELVPEAGKDGYSAAYELDWIALEGVGTGECMHLPLILK